MAKYERDQSILRPIKAWAESSTKCKLAIIFGSFATSTVRPESDLDIALWWEHHLDASTKQQLNIDISNLVSRTVDIIDLRLANGILLKHILNDGEILILRGPAIMGNLHIRLLDWETDFAPAWRDMHEQRRKRFFQPLEKI